MGEARRVCARPILPDGSQGEADTYVLASEHKRELAALMNTVREFIALAPDSLHARVMDLHHEIEGAIPAMREYATKHPLHLTAFGMQDANGVHAWLKRNDSVAITPAEETKTSGIPYVATLVFDHETRVVRGVMPAEEPVPDKDRGHAS